MNPEDQNNDDDLVGQEDSQVYADYEDSKIDSLTGGMCGEDTEEEVANE